MFKFAFFYRLVVSERKFSRREKKDRSAIDISMEMSNSDTANGVLAAETEGLLDTGGCGW